MFSKRTERGSRRLRLLLHQWKCNQSWCGSIKRTVCTPIAVRGERENRLMNSGTRLLERMDLPRERISNWWGDSSVPIVCEFNRSIRAGLRKPSTTKVSLLRCGGEAFRRGTEDLGKVASHRSISACRPAQRYVPRKKCSLRPLLHFRNVANKSDRCTMIASSPSPSVHRTIDRRCSEKCHRHPSVGTVPCGNRFAQHDAGCGEDVSLTGRHQSSTA